ncbi:hypothetical protein BLNAU_201 [Blattamonas nauphoetae]|uniref:EIPR1-like beta-propeller domain-containing protein n=1 Tax=Blattamonas nauphoetae TaxID=2049346 RepID=A0ABQ9YMB4_9EUKA|nr:hypothetical protein BLNAU_201 [Blattamonas nauphoetae]
MTDSSTDSVLGFNMQTRCVEGIYSNEGNPKFLISSSTVKNENEIYLVQHDVVMNQASIQSIFPHPQEILHMTTSPHNPAHVFTSTVPNPQSTTSLFVMHESAPSRRTGNLQTLFEFPITTPACISPSPSLSSLVALRSTDSVSLWQQKDGSFVQQESSSHLSQTKSNSYEMCSSWDKDGTRLCVNDSLGIQVFDAKTEYSVSSLRNIHCGPISSLCFHSINQNHILSASTDGSLALSDLRNFTAPLAIFFPHRLRISFLSCNQNGLVLSGATDGTVNVWDPTTWTLRPDAPETITPLQTVPTQNSSVTDGTWCMSKHHPFLFLSLSLQGMANITTLHSSIQSKYISRSH